MFHIVMSLFAAIMALYNIFIEKDTMMGMIWIIFAGQMSDRYELEKISDAVLKRKAAESNYLNYLRSKGRG